VNKRVLALLVAAAAVLPAGASADPIGPTADQCAPAGAAAQAICYGADVLTRDGQAYAQPGRYDAAIAAYEKSWTHRALGLQYSLANDVGFANAPWPGTHNSFNSIAEEGPSLSDTDSNQQLRLTDQLRLDMRSLELDVHWFPSPAAGGQNAPVVCHAGAVSEHDGCTVERLLGPILDEIRDWLHAHDDQVLLLYIEDHLDSGYDTAAGVIQSELGKLVYPTGSSGAGDCRGLPMALTRNDVLAAGAQVVIVSSCGSGAAWRGLAFNWDKHVEETPHGFKDFPDCGPDYTRATYDSTLVRYYEDSTWLSAGASAAQGGDVGDGGLKPSTVRSMMRCGVDLLGFDQLVPDDGRLDALVWSWAKDEPAAGGDCAAMGADGRWSSGSCKRRLRPACRTSGGDWLVPKKKVTLKGAAGVCRDAGAAFAVPRTGYENQLLKRAAAGAAVRLGYVRADGGWTALDKRHVP
jgi:hypothetical protein